jgi:hypothetical protein
MLCQTLSLEEMLLKRFNMTSTLLPFGSKRRQHYMFLVFQPLLSLLPTIFNHDHDHDQDQGKRETESSTSSSEVGLKHLVKSSFEAFVSTETDVQVRIGDMTMSTSKCKVLFQILFLSKRVAFMLRKLYSEYAQEHLLEQLKLCGNGVSAGRISSAEMVKMLADIREKCIKVEIMLLPHCPKDKRLSDEAFRLSILQLPESHSLAVANLLVLDLCRILDKSQSSEQSQSSKLLELLQLMPCNEDFWGIYTQRLKDRLIRRREVSLDQEERMLQRLPSATSMLKANPLQMLKDLRSSEEFAFMHSSITSTALAMHEYRGQTENSDIEDDDTDSDLDDNGSSSYSGALTDGALRAAQFVQCDGFFCSVIRRHAWPLQSVQACSGAPPVALPSILVETCKSFESMVMQ